MKITVVGLGYVGLANSILLARYNEVIALDIDAKRVNAINNRISPISDTILQDYFDDPTFKLRATQNTKIAYKGADFIIVCAPTDFDETRNNFDTSIVESVIADAVSHCPSATIVIRSTVPIGFTDEISYKFANSKFIFSPEFLREGKALYDNLFPSRIVIGSHASNAEEFGMLLKQGAISKNIPVVKTSPKAAEAIKLFANSYLAMRVAYFNELDSFAIMHGLDSKSIIEGVSYDPRIGMHYNNPSFGYGGYCLPKDTKQLLSSCNNSNQRLLSATIESNSLRVETVCDDILKHKPETIGIYRLIMKEGSDNFRNSSILNMIKRLKSLNTNIIIFEPKFDKNLLPGFDVEKNFKKFVDSSDIIVTNRMEDCLNIASSKVYTRDIFGSN